MAIGLTDESTLLAKIDGFNILAPGFLKLHTNNLIGFHTKINIDDIRPKIHQEISFKHPTSQISSYALTKDWNNREDWGVWSRGKDVTLTLPLPASPPKLLTLNLRAFVNGAIPTQSVQISSDGEALGNFSLSKFDGNIIQLELPKSSKQKGYVTLDFNLPNAASPSSIGMDEDSRVLGIGVVSARFD